MIENRHITLNAQEVQDYLPNRYPYLMIDRATEVIPGVSAKGYKNLSTNEWFYPVHFPEEPMMPGMIQMEALLQMLSLTILTMDEYRGKKIRGTSANGIRLKRRVVPGDRLDIEAKLISIEGTIVKGKAFGVVNGESTCEAEFTFEVI